MRFTVPKPVHGWRTFWGEVGIIVLGVLIALGAQQVAEKLSVRQRADDSTATLRAEIIDHGQYAYEIEVVAPCIRAQAEALEERLKTVNSDPAPRFSEDGFKAYYVVRIPDRPWSSSAWDAVRNEDALRQVDPAFARQMYKYYAQLTWMLADNRSAVDLAATLNSLSIVVPRDEGDRMRYIDAAEKLIDTTAKMALVAGQLRDRMAKTGLLPLDRDLKQALAESGTIKFCRAHRLPLATPRRADPKEAD